MNSLEREVLAIIGENPDAPDVFTDDSTGMAQIRTSINDAIQELMMVTGGYKRTYYLPLMEGRNFYRMAWTTDYFGYVVEAWDRQRHYRLQQTDIVKLCADDPDWMKRTGEALQYFHVGFNVIGIYMKPSQTGKIIELECVCIPREYTEDTDPIKLRKPFEQAVINYAVGEFYASRGDAVRAGEHHQKYIEYAMLKRLMPYQQEWQFRYGGYKNTVEIR